MEFICLWAFSLMKSEHHQINIVPVLFVKRGKNKQEKTKTSHFQLFIFCLEDKRIKGKVLSRSGYACSIQRLLDQKAGVLPTELSYHLILLGVFFNNLFML